MAKTTFDFKVVFNRIRQAVSINVGHRLTVLTDEGGEALKRFFDPLFPEVFIFEGEERGSAMPLTIAYAGNHAQVEEYWIQTALTEGWRKHSLGRQFYSNIPGLIRRAFPDCNMLLIEHNAMTKPRSGFLVPEALDLEIDISAPLERLMGNQRADIERRIRKNELTYEFTKDARQFDEFYHNMYLPYMRQRHSTPAAIASYSALAEVFARGELILVKNGTKVLCGGLFEVQNGRVRCHKMGVKDGSWEYVREGAVSACYYFLITEMKKRGLKKINLGGIRPLLNDGVTQFKISLKAQLALSQHNPLVSMMLLRYSPGIESFLINNPFICFEEDGGGYRAVFFRPEDLPNEEFNDMVLDVICHGLLDSHIFVFSEVVERSNYFFSVKPAYPMFNNGASMVKAKSPKVSWVKALQNSLAGG